MARTRLVLRRSPNPNPRQMPNVDFQTQRVAATKELGRRIRASDVKIKFLLAQIKSLNSFLL